MEELTDEQRDILRHSLGLDYPDKIRRNKGKPYRNYYCAVNGDQKLESLADSGLMVRGCTLNEGCDRYYFVTAAGAAAVGSVLPEES